MDKLKELEDKLMDAMVDASIRGNDDYTKVDNIRYQIALLTFSDLTRDEFDYADKYLNETRRAYSMNDLIKMLRDEPFKYRLELHRMGWTTHKHFKHKKEILVAPMCDTDSVDHKELLKLGFKTVTLVNKEWDEYSLTY